MAETKPSSGPISPLLDQLAHFALLHFATAHHLVDHERAVLRLVAAQGLDHRLAVGRGEDVGDACVGVVLLEIFRPLDDSFGDLDDLGHELAARKFAVLHLAQLEFPFAGHVGLGQGVGLHGGEKLRGATPPSWSEPVRAAGARDISC